MHAEHFYWGLDLVSVLLWICFWNQIILPTILNVFLSQIQGKEPLGAVPYAAGVCPWINHLNRPPVNWDCPVKCPHDRTLTDWSDTSVSAFLGCGQTNQSLNGWRNLFTLWDEKISPFHMPQCLFESTLGFSTHENLWEWMLDHNIIFICYFPFLVAFFKIIIVALYISIIVPRSQI